MTEDQPFLCIGHRGAMGHAPENTLKSFELAIQMGCPWVELDVHVVEDQLIVIHDEKLERTTNGQGLISETSFSDIRQLDAGDGERVPTLEEVLNLVAGRVGVNVELKGANTAGPVNQLLARYCDEQSQLWSPDSFLISSFNQKELALADPKYPRGVLYHKAKPDMIEGAVELGGFSINLSLDIVEEAVVKKAHTAGLKTFVYTVNSTEDMTTLRAMGVDGVFTNFPDRFPWSPRLT